MVDIGGIEIRAASFYERVDHLLQVLDVDALLILGVSKGQTHAAKTELRGIQKIAHRGSLPSEDERCTKQKHKTA